MYIRAICSNSIEYILLQSNSTGLRFGNATPVEFCFFKLFCLKSVQKTDFIHLDYLLFTLFTFSFLKNTHPFYVGIEISESLCGKTIDLTKPIVKSGTLEPYLGIIASADGTTIEIDNSEGSIDISVQEADSPLTVTSGTLKVTKNGGDFSVKFFVNLSDGRYIAADWKGTAKKVEIPG